MRLQALAFETVAPRSIRHVGRRKESSGTGWIFRALADRTSPEPHLGPPLWSSRPVTASDWAREEAESFRTVLARKHPVRAVRARFTDRPVNSREFS